MRGWTKPNRNDARPLRFLRSCACSAEWLAGASKAAVQILSCVIRKRLRSTLRVPSLECRVPASSINLPKHDVIRADHRDHVSQHMALDDGVHRGKMRETGRAQMAAEWFIGAVGD